MSDWGDTALTFDRSVDGWGSAAGEGLAEEGATTLRYLELIGSQLWVAGMVDLGRFRRVSDYVNLLDGYLRLADAVVLARSGDVSRLAMPEFRVRPDDISIVGQLADEHVQPSSEVGVYVEKHPVEVVLMTSAHIISGHVFIHGDGSIMAFVDATDPKFFPMSDVKIRWIADRKVAAHYPFALVQRKEVLGVATEGIRLAGDMEVKRRASIVEATKRAAREEAATAGVARGGSASSAESEADDQG